MNTVKLFSFKWITIVIILILSCTIFTRAGQGKPAPPLPRIAFIAASPYETAGDPVRKAYDWLKNCAGFTAEYLEIPKAAAKLGRSGRYQAVWICRMDTNVLTPAETGQKFLKALDTYVRNGGRLLLSHQAMHYLNLLGFEDRPVQDSTKRCSDDGYGRRLGFHAFHDHPVFQGLNGGTYTCRPRKDISVRISGFFGNNVPSGGKVVAVDWDYIFLRENSKLIVEYQSGKGKVLAVGGYMDFSIRNDNMIHLERFTGNCLHYLTDDTSQGVACYWDYSPAEVRECPTGPESDRLLVAPPAGHSWKINPSDIALTGRFATGNFWDVASERMVTMGVEKGGIEEVWAHPFMAFRDYEVGIRFSYRDTIYWLNDERPEITVDPAYFSRKYKFPRAYLTETVVNDPNDPAGVIHYEYRGVYPAELIIRFTSNLRLMWPYSEQATGSVCHRWHGDLEAFSMADHTGRMTVILGGNRSPSEHQSGRYSSFAYSRKDSLFHGVASDKVQAAGLLRYNLAMNDNLDIVYAASNEGYDTTCAAYQRAVQDPEGIFRGATGHVARLFHESLLITTPDAVFNKGYRWAIAATDRFFVHTPGMGKALVAGYSTTRHGWDGGHAVNGRPGYGWYFGRDAEWSGFALLDYGDYPKVKSQLEFFNKYQDLNGKIFHEASTSGLVHYDAADATPLYLVLAGKYFRHTNDTAFLRATWPNIRKAIEFCFSTDTDGDHLIENTNVGHGWVEGGELYGSHSTIYMAGAWGAALREAANMGRFMKDREWSRYEAESEMQHALVDDEFWSDSGHYYAYGKNSDGSFRREQTILPAVPVLFGMAARENAQVMLNQVASNVFTTNWGARILREDSPWFKPTGYHYGSVWPLFTGWASLAEYSVKMPVQGFGHLMNNLKIYRNWALGLVEEVMNGAVYQPSGVCAHQCWSETMVLQPALEGMLGLEVDAGKKELTLSPQLPPQWDSLSASQIRMGEQTVDFHFNRIAKGCRYRFSPGHGKPVTVRFMPAFAPGTEVLGVTVDGKPAPFTSFRDELQSAVLLTLALSGNTLVEIETTGGISVLPVVQDPKPGDPAEGLRILAARLKGNRYEIEAEGLSGSSGTVECWSPGSTAPKAENAEFIGRTGNVSRYSILFEKSAGKYATKKIILKDWQP